MKIKHLFLVCFLFIIAVNATAQNSCDFLSRVQNYQDSVKVIKRPNDNGDLVAEVDTSTFNMNDYMNLFDKIRYKDGKVGLMINNYGPTAGQPLLYAKDSNFDIEKYIAETKAREIKQIDSILSKGILKYKNLKHKKKSLSEKEINQIIEKYEKYKYNYDSRNILRFFTSDTTNSAHNNIIPDDSPEGYLQYLFFHQMGEQFALHWHSYYGQRAVICNKKDVNYYLHLYNSLRKDDFDYNESELRDLLQVDLSPIIELDATSCTITWYIIWTHHGIFKETFTIQRKHPFGVEMGKSQEISKIEANFLY